MRHLASVVALVAWTAVGCGPEPAPTVESEIAAEEASLESAGTPTSDAGSAAVDDAPGQIGGQEATRIALSPENAKIEFIGLHAGGEPNPRHGTFEQFTGVALLDQGRLASVEATIDTESVTTEIGRLTNHLKSPDFFDVRTFPQATFRSTSIKESGNGQVTVTGELTLHGVTREISFPATVTTNDGLELEAEFSIDRTEFGMDYSVEKVVADVALVVSIDA